MMVILRWGIIKMEIKFQELISYLVSLSMEEQEG